MFTTETNTEYWSSYLDVSRFLNCGDVWLLFNFMVKVVRNDATLTSVGQAMEIQEVSFNTVSHGQRKAIENNEFLFYLLNIFLN